MRSIITIAALLLGVTADADATATCTSAAASPPNLLGLKDGVNTTGKLLEALRKERAFIAPHHTAWTGTDWDAADPEIQRHVEIVSVHGAFEYKDNQPIPPRGELDGMFAVDAPATPRTIALVRGGRTLRDLPVTGPSVHGTSELVLEPGNHGLYLRVVIPGDNDKVDVAWSSPVFITVK